MEMFTLGMILGNFIAGILGFRIIKISCAEANKNNNSGRSGEVNGANGYVNSGFKNGAGGDNGKRLFDFYI